MQNQRLPIDDMEQRHEGLTPALAETFKESARVCLDRHHVSPIPITIKRSEREMFADLEWEATDGRTRGALANTIDTTEWGAYACVLAAVELFDGLVAVLRAETETGSDYYVAPPGVSADDFEGHMRLEVSGVDRGNDAAVRRRLREKLDQLARGGGDVPGIAGVIGFRAQLILLQNLETA